MCESRLLLKAGQAKWISGNQKKKRLFGLEVFMSKRSEPLEINWDSLNQTRSRGFPIADIGPQEPLEVQEEPKAKYASIEAEPLDEGYPQYMSELLTALGVPEDFLVDSKGKPPIILSPLFEYSYPDAFWAPADIDMVESEEK